ncbi:MAG: preprotein translocase subunit YajC [Mesorhizobium sp.]|nr:MAG: preprotein translocase subunit YajC [Mesorhizobium sp.]
MLHYSVPREFEIGDEVALTSTVITVLPSGRARVSIPSYDHPYPMDAPPKARGDKLVLVGDIIRIDREANKLTVRIDCGEVITIDKSAIARLRKHRQGSRPDAH